MHSRDGSDGGPFIWLGVAFFAPVTLFYLYSRGALVLTPMSIVGLVLLAIGLVKRDRASRNEPVLPPHDRVDPGDQRTSQPPPPPSADD